MAKAMEVSARVGKGKDASAPVTVKYNMPDTVAELVSTFGEDVVKAHVQSSVIISLQGFIRARIKKALDENKTPDARTIANDVAKWKPGLRTPGKSKLERLTEQTKKMSAEDKKALLDQLKAELAAR